MDRKIVYPGQIPFETDLLDTNRNALIGLGKLAAAMLGTNTMVNGLACTPTSPASLQVWVAPGEIYSLQNLDGTAYSSLAADTAHQIVKQGLLMDQATLNCPAPATAGQSVNYLVQALYEDKDVLPLALPYYNASNPAQAYSGPANSGTAQNTMRKGVCTVLVKAGTAATTGSQITPTPDVGYVGLYVVTVANGQMTITASNITQAANAPLLPSAVLPSVQNNAFNYALDTGTVNTYQASYNPPVTQLTDGMMLSFRAKNTNIAGSTFSPNGLAAKQIYSQAHVALLSGEIAVNGLVEVVWNSLLNGWVLCENSGGIAHGTTPGAGDNSQKLATTAFVQSAIAAGHIMFFASASAPTGYLKANGSAISRTAYASLFSAIGTTFGAGDGSTTFNLPDLRGEFLRGFDDGRGVDAGRGFGSPQSDLYKSHAHNTGGYMNAQDSGGGSWTLTGQAWPVARKGFAVIAPPFPIDSEMNSAGQQPYSGGSETRPRNIALLACIKY
jgi:microcystin-dependent protein